MLHSMLSRFVHVGRLVVTEAGKGPITYGDGSGPEVRVHFAKGWGPRMALNPDLALGEAYMEGGLTIEQGDLWTLLELVGRNLGQYRDPPKLLMRLLAHVNRLTQQWNDRSAARRNVAHHYDLSYELYRRFLDEDMQYSCAYFARPDMTLEQAQFAKKTHIAAKLMIEPGQRVLDIGCGWGGMGLELAGRYGAQVSGVTLSKEQLAIAQARAKAANLDQRVDFSLTDYRDVEGPFDRIVSVGMFEHVGAPNFRTYFQQVSRLLTDDGIALIHTIGRRTGPGITQPWIAKYIFPGGYIPALSEMSAAIEDAGLWITDVEIQRLHYAETLKAWRERFMAQRDEIAALYDERFCRMWEFYLAFSELGFRYGISNVFQVQLTKRVAAAPPTRDYMFDGERAVLDGTKTGKARSVA
ncbi:MAG: cfa2 [Caulobacteraceae bacterium]|jgi:cyclopropane-fatty-acyl-phospholipid synthase|nr:cfa2 [Caulobacteraceae bacterium]